MQHPNIRNKTSNYYPSDIFCIICFFLTIIFTWVFEGSCIGKQLASNLRLTKINTHAKHSNDIHIEEQYSCLKSNIFTTRTITSCLRTLIFSCLRFSFMVKRDRSLHSRIKANKNDNQSLNLSLFLFNCKVQELFEKT